MCDYCGNKGRRQGEEKPRLELTAVIRWQLTVAWHREKAGRWEKRSEAGAMEGKSLAWSPQFGSWSGRFGGQSEVSSGPQSSLCVSCCPSLVSQNPAGLSFQGKLCRVNGLWQKAALLPLLLLPGQTQRPAVSTGAPLSPGIRGSVTWPGKAFSFNLMWELEF